MSGVEESTPNEITKRLLELIGQSGKEPDGLSDALYTISEGGGWPDYVDSVSAKQAMTCWRIVEWLRHNTIPDHLKL